MKIISHRGYLNGSDSIKENSIQSVNECIELGFDIEIDIRLNSNNLFLGHDIEKNNISVKWLIQRKDFLWIHCKSFETLNFFIKENLDLNFFWHEKDAFTITSKNFIWAYPSKEIFKNTVNVLPELNLNDEEILEKQKDIFAICTDYPQKYSNLIN
jgi:glycerophosphoryl diester phosphodiesterase